MKTGHEMVTQKNEILCPTSQVVWYMSPQIKNIRHPCLNTIFGFEKNFESQRNKIKV